MRDWQISGLRWGKNLGNFGKKKRRTEIKVASWIMAPQIWWDLYIRYQNASEQRNGSNDYSCILFVRCPSTLHDILVLTNLRGCDINDTICCHWIKNFNKTFAANSQEIDHPFRWRLKSTIRLGYRQSPHRWNIHLLIKNRLASPPLPQKSKIDHPRE